MLSVIFTIQTRGARASEIELLPSQENIWSTQKFDGHNLKVIDHEKTSSEVKYLLKPAIICIYIINNKKTTIRKWREN